MDSGKLTYTAGELTLSGELTPAYVRRKELLKAIKATQYPLLDVMGNPMTSDEWLALSHIVAALATLSEEFSTNTEKLGISSIT